MTKIKLCGLSRMSDIDVVNELMPEYIGFIFVPSSKRYVSPKQAQELRKQLHKEIIPVGVFVDEKIDQIVEMLDRNIIDVVQLHGNEDETYISMVREQTGCTIIKAFCIKNVEDIRKANRSVADYVILDSGGGLGETFDWSLIGEMKRPFFLAGGLTVKNINQAILKFQPFAVDASSSLETDGLKDKDKMTAFVKAVRQRKD